MWTDEYGELDDDDETMFEFANAMLNTLSVLSAFHLAIQRTRKTQSRVSQRQSVISRSHSRFSALTPPPENPGTKTRKHAATGKRHVLLRTVRNCVHRAQSRRFQPRTQSY